MNKVKFFNTSLTAAIILIAALILQADGPKQEDGLYATLQTNRGEIKIKFYFDRTPLTVCNFVGLAEGKLKNSATTAGVPYFDGIKWHRVVVDWVIQSGDNKGGPGYSFRCEPDTPYLKHDKPGVVGMANTGAGTPTNGSQFYITHTTGSQYDRLNGGYTIFGQVIDTGMKTVMRIVQGDQLTKVTISRVGEKALAFRADQKMFDSLKANPSPVIKQTTVSQSRNPFPVRINHGYVSIVTDKADKIGCDIFTISGRMVCSLPQRDVFKGSTVLPYRFQPGTYILRIKPASAVFTQRLMVQ